MPSLILTPNEGATIEIGEARVKILKTRAKRVTVRIEAPKHVSIVHHRLGKPVVAEGDDGERG